MRQCLALTVFILTIALPACKTARPGATTLKDEPVANAGEIFVGCRPSAGECMNSCAQRNGIAREIHEVCAPGTFEPVACFCPTGSAPPEAEPPTTTHTFVGCRPSPSECRYSCPSASLIFLKPSARCQDAPYSEGACFCQN